MLKYNKLYDKINKDSNKIDTFVTYGRKENKLFNRRREKNKMDVNYNIDDKETLSLVPINELRERLTFKQITYEKVKRLIDIIGAICGMIIMVPVTIIIYLAQIIVGDKGPIFYSQTRLGKDGKHFKLYKFRTMIVGADKILDKYLAENEEARIEFEKNQKLRDDPRITKLGKFLRQTSLDELPQFINVMKGDMSIIGPRPIVDREVKLFGNKMATVHKVKPGITGFWAANGRSDTTYEQRVDMEAFYAENYSLKMDIKVFLKTIETVIKREGAV